MSRSNIKEFQPDMKHLTCLKILKFDGCEVEKTPDFTGAHRLEKVSFHSCSKLVQVHQSIGSLKGLLELDVRLTAIKNMPFSLGWLSKLKNLDLSLLRSRRTTRHCAGRAALLPPSVAQLCSLESLCSHSNNLYEIDLPIGLGSLTSLTDLRLSGCFYIQNFPFSLRDLPFFKRRLNLDDWQSLRVLKDLPPTLELLFAGNCVSLEKIEDISTLQRLRQLYIPNCKNLAPLPGLETLENLRLLEIRNCSRLTPPLVENWFQARSEAPSEAEGNSVTFHLKGWGADSLECHVPTLVGSRSIRTTNPAISDSSLQGVRISVSSRTTDTWVEAPDEYTTFEFMKYKIINFVVPRKIGERLEVYAEFKPSVLTLCLFEIQRTVDGEWRFFPSTRGWLPSAWGYLQVYDEPTTSHREKRRKLLQGDDEPTTSHREPPFEDIATGITQGFRPKEHCYLAKARGGRRIVPRRPRRPSQAKSSILTRKSDGGIRK